VGVEKAARCRVVRGGGAKVEEVVAVMEPPQSGIQNVVPAALRTVLGKWERRGMVVCFFAVPCFFAG